MLNRKSKSPEHHSSMRKHKNFMEEEYPIIDVFLKTGASHDQFNWVCEKIVEDQEGVKSLTTFKA